MDHEADQAGIGVLELAVDLVEAAEEDVALLRRSGGPQPHRALGGLQGGGVDGADQGRGRDHQRELREHLAGQAGQEGGRQEHRHQHQGDADHGSEQLVHCLDRGVVGRHAPFDVMGDTLDDHDRIVDHDADRQHDAEHGRGVDREAQRGHGGEGADDRHGDRGRRHQHRAPVLQEDHDHDQDQDAGLDQGHEDFVDRCLHEERGVERHLVGEAGRERLRQFGHLGLHAIGDIERIGVGQLVDREARIGLAVDVRGLGVGLGAQLDPADVPHPNDPAAIALLGLDDDVAEFLGRAEASDDVDRVLEIQALGRGRLADLTGRYVLALLLDDLAHVRRGEAERVEFLRVEPDAHRVLADAQHVDVADTGQAREFVDEIDGGVVAEIEAVVALVGGGQRHDLQDRRRLLLHDEALCLHRHGQRSERRADLILHQHLREIQVGADLERDRQRVGPGVRAVGLHVDHLFDAVDLQLDRQGNVVDDDGSTRARIGRCDLDRGRHDVGILRDRQGGQCHAADQHDDDGEDVGQNRPVDEEGGNHGCAPRPVTWVRLGVRQEARRECRRSPRGSSSPWGPPWRREWRRRWC